ncbi:MAG: HAD family hydrolase [Anaerostipes sp.]|jgi:beta-phosphoglucomutase
MAKAVIFDMDGVIVDTEPGYFRCINHVLGLHGKSISKELNNKFIGVSNTRMWTSVINHFQINTTIEDCMDEMWRFREQMIEEEGLHPIDGTIELIQKLHANKVPLAVASSSPKDEIKRVVKLFEIEPYFDMLMSGEDCVESKPHPDIFLYTAKGLKKNPKECLVIEDSRNGVIAAKKAGMKAIGYCNPEFGLPSLPEADIEVNSIHKITTELCLDM